MKDFDFYALDGHLLRTFLTILDESSVSRAADRLGVTQSAVSHSLARLRRILGDPLFVRSGQGLTPTETALSLKAPVQEVLDRLKGLTALRAFDPRTEAMRFVIAANDMQRDLVLPELMRGAIAGGIDLALRIEPSGVPSVSLLRDAKCDLLLTPIPPDAPDMIQLRLFSGAQMCFYDPDATDPPRTVESYLAADHVAVQFALGGGSNDLLRVSALPYVPKPRVTVPNFAGITPFVRGTNMLSTQSAMMQRALISQLAMAPLPFEAAPVTVYMVWHERSTSDPAHRWLRETVRQICAKYD